MKGAQKFELLSLSSFPFIGSQEEQSSSDENDTAKILVLMGSNRKHGPLHRLFPQKTITVIPCVSMSKAKTILNSYRMDTFASNDLHHADIDDVEVGLCVCVCVSVCDGVCV